MSTQKPIAVVAGGAGFIGSHLATALVAQHYIVRVVDNLRNGKRERVPEGAAFFEQDILDTEALTRVMEGATTVFHLAALPRVPYSLEHPVETTDQNITGTVSVLTAATGAKVRRVIYSASGSAYGEQAVLPFVETMTANPVNPYGLQKYVGELFARLWSHTYGIETVSLRYFNVYGPGLDPNGPYALAIGKFALARKNNEPITIFGDGTITRDFTHVSDVVRANLLAAESQNVGKGEVINIGSGRNVSVKALADMFGGEIVYGPPRIEAHDSLADVSRAKKLLNWEPRVRLEDGIADLKKEFGL